MKLKIIRWKSILFKSIFLTFKESMNLSAINPSNSFWHQEIQTHLFSSAGSDLLAPQYQAITSLLDPTLSEIQKEFHYDNTPSDFFETLSTSPEPGGLRAAYEDSLEKFDLRDNLIRTGGDECLGLALACLRKIGALFSRKENLEKIYPIDHTKEIIIDNCIEKNPCSFEMSFTSLEGTAIKISSYISGFLSNSPLPYYHFATVVQLEEQTTPQKRIFFVADPGEGMTQLYSHFETRNVGSGTARITSLNEKKDLLHTPYFKWVEKDPNMQSLIKNHGLCAEGFWRRHQCAILINKPLSLEDLHQGHSRLVDFLLYPKLVKFDGLGAPSSYIAWDFLKQSVSIYFNGTLFKINQTSLDRLQAEGSLSIDSERVDYEHFLASWGSAASEGSVISQKIRHVSRFFDTFYCEIINAHFLREEVPGKLLAEIERLSNDLSISIEATKQSLIQDPHFGDRIFKETGKTYPMLFRKIGNCFVTPLFVKQIAET